MCHTRVLRRDVTYPSSQHFFPISWASVRIYVPADTDTSNVTSGNDKSVIVRDSISTDRVGICTSSPARARWYARFPSMRSALYLGGI